MATASGFGIEAVSRFLDERGKLRDALEGGGHLRLATEDEPQLADICED